jgi:hypothetical protein
MNDLARELISQMRQQAGREVTKGAPMPEMGIVTKESPLQIKPAFTGRTSAGTSKGSYTLTAKDILARSDESLSSGDVVILVPVKGGYWYAQKVRSGEQAPSNADGGQRGSDTTASTPDPVNANPDEPIPTDLEAGEKIVEVARRFTGMRGSGSPNSYLSGSGASVAAWCNDVIGSGGLTLWCAVFTSKVYELANVDMGACRSASVATQAANGTDLGNNPVMGCLACRGGDHVMIYISGGIQNALIIGGNQGMGGAGGSSNNGVTEVRRNLTGHKFVAPPGLLRGARATEIPTGTGVLV